VHPKRGEVWWVALDPVVGSEIAKTRPCLILTQDLVNQYRRTVVIVPLSSSPVAHPPMMVAVKCAGKAAVAVVDQVRAVAKERLRNIMGSLGERDMKAIENALKEILDLV
jgi:mRNA interferase MazF